MVVNPSFVVGPLLAPQPTSTLQLILTIVKGKTSEFPLTLMHQFRLMNANSKFSCENHLSRPAAELLLVWRFS